MSSRAPFISGFHGRRLVLSRSFVEAGTPSSQPSPGLWRVHPPACTDRVKRRCVEAATQEAPQRGRTRMHARSSISGLPGGSDVSPMIFLRGVESPRLAPRQGRRGSGGRNHLLTASPRTLLAPGWAVCPNDPADHQAPGSCPGTSRCWNQLAADMLGKRSGSTVDDVWMFDR